MPETVKDREVMASSLPEARTNVKITTNQITTNQFEPVRTPHPDVSLRMILSACTTRGNEP